MEEKHREREASDDVNEKEMDGVDYFGDVNEIEILEAPLPPTPIKVLSFGPLIWGVDFLQTINN